MYNLLRSIKVAQLEIHRYKPSQLEIEEQVGDRNANDTEDDCDNSSYLPSDPVEVQLPVNGVTDKHEQYETRSSSAEQANQ